MKKKIDKLAEAFKRLPVAAQDELLRFAIASAAMERPKPKLSIVPVNLAKKAG
jgi:hypothetical protein